MEFCRRRIAVTRELHRGDSLLAGIDCAANGIAKTQPILLPTRGGESPYGATHLPPIVPKATSPGLLAVLAVRHVARHVNERGPSPFVSFTEKPAIAQSWATNHYTRTQGAVITVTVRLVAASYWQTVGGRWVFAFEDDSDRVWLRTNSYRALLEEVITPQVMADLRTRGLFDAEWLLLRGEIPASAITLLTLGV